jgi:CoA:oxalate CoA-transferase
MPKLLAGLLVLDFTHALSGPFCTMILGDLGARIIKVEPPNGDEARQWGPFVNGRSAYFANVNRGKQSIVLDLKQPEGREVARRLAARADVLVENFRPAKLTSLGLGYSTLAEANPRLIYLSLSGFGQTGPYAERGAYDVIIQAMSGLMGITGPEGGQPTRVGASVGDTVPALFGAVGILAALHARGAYGRGCWIDLAMLDCVVAITENALARFQSTGVSPKPLGNRHPSIAPFGVFSTGDGQIALGAATDVVFRRLVAAIGSPDLANQPEYLTNDLRTRNVGRLIADLDALFARRSSAEWIELLLGVGVPCGPVATIADVIRNEHLWQRNALVEVLQPGIGQLVEPGSPIKAGGFEDDVRQPAPDLGEHTADVLAELLAPEADDV